MLKRFFSIVFATAFLTNAAFAAQSVSLVTVTPGPEAQSAFGHAALLIQDDTKPGQATIFEYGALQLERVFITSDFMTALGKLLRSEIKTSPMKSPAKIDPSFKIPTRFVTMYLKKNTAEREVIVNKLELTDEQVTKLLAALEADLKAGAYNYHNFTKNCATQIRDRLFDPSILGADARKEMAKDVDQSFQSISMASIDEAAKASASKKVELLPIEFTQRFPGMAEQSKAVLGIMGITPSFSSGKDFYEAFAKGDKMMQTYAAGDPVADDFHNYFFSAEMSTKPIERYKTLFTPKNLRTALIETINPETKKPVIDVTAEIKQSTSSVAAAQK